MIRYLSRGEPPFDGALQWMTAPQESGAAWERSGLIFSGPVLVSTPTKGEYGPYPHSLIHFFVQTRLFSTSHVRTNQGAAYTELVLVGLYLLEVGEYTGLY